MKLEKERKRREGERKRVKEEEGKEEARAGDVKGGSAYKKKSRKR